MNSMLAGNLIAVESYRGWNEKFVRIAIRAWDDGGEGCFVEWVREYVGKCWVGMCWLN